MKIPQNNLSQKHAFINGFLAFFQIFFITEAFQNYASSAYARIPSLSLYFSPYYVTISTEQKGVVTIRTQQEVNAIIRQLCSGLKPLFPLGSMEAILFGSYARGEADAESDIDVMVLVDSSRQDISEKTWEISSVAADLLLDRGVMVSPIVENRRYFQDNIGFLPFYQNIAREGVRYSA